MTDKNAIDSLLAELQDPSAQDLQGSFEPVADAEPARPRRDLPQMMRKIPVTLTLEVGSARVSLQELVELGAESVVELDTPAGQPLVLKVNGTVIGRAEVVVSGENYGLKVIEIAGLDLDALNP